MKNINNLPQGLRNSEELKNELKELKDKREEAVEEKTEFEPGTIHILNVYLTNVEENIRKIKEKLGGLTETPMT